MYDQVYTACARNSVSIECPYGDWFLEYNENQSDIFIQERPKRRRYRKRHPCEVAVFKCMDGRVNFPILTQTPMGIVQSYQNIGGRFNLGWSQCGHLVYNLYEFAIRRKRRYIAFLTYHYSHGEKTRGCRGFHYEKELACAEAVQLKEQCEFVFGTDHDHFYPIVVGIETDVGALVFHGKSGQVENMLSHIETSDAVLELAMEDVLINLYPDMSRPMRRDILPFMIGNIRHIRNAIADNNPPDELGHKEFMLCVGRGFDWFQKINCALQVGSYGDEFPQVVEKAAAILRENIELGHVSENQGILLVGAAPFNYSRDEAQPYSLRNAGQRLAELNARHLTEIAYKVVTKTLANVHVLTGTVDMQTRRFLPVTTS